MPEQQMPERPVKMSTALLESMKKRLKNDDYVMQSLAMLKVSIDKGDEPIEAMRKAIMDFILEFAKDGYFDKN